jgi:hypothetical protein
MERHTTLLKISQRYERSFLVAVMLLLCGPRSHGQEWSWTREVVDVAGGTFSALAVDDAGNVHMGYLSPEGGGTKYAFRTETGHWFTAIVDKNNGSVNIALDKSQRPHLCYFPVGTLKYAYWDGKRWQIEEVAPGSGERNFTCGIAVDSDSNPHLTWYQYTDVTGQPYVHIRHAVRAKGVWRVRTVDFGYETGKWNCLRADSQGHTYVSYSAFREGAFRFAMSGDFGDTWKVTTIEDGRNGRWTTPGMGNSMVLDQRGRPNFSYRDETTLRYAWPDGDGWRIDVVDPNANPSGNMSWISQRTALALDANGQPHIVYDTDGALKHAWWDGVRWRVQPMGIVGPQHRYPSLAISKDNVIYIGYSDPEGGTMEVLVGRPGEETRKQSLPGAGTGSGDGGRQP